MRIGICALGAISQDTGGQTYIINLCRALRLMGGENEYIFFVSSGEGAILDMTKSNFKIVEVPHSSSGVLQRVAAEQFKLPSLIRKHDIEVMYYPNNFASVMCPVPFVVAIRSMLYYHYPDAIGAVRNIYRKILTPLSAAKARYIITPSQDIKNDIIRFVNVPADKIKVVNHGVHVSLFEKKYDANEFTGWFREAGIDRPFLLYVSALWEYKNHDKLILAFRKLTENTAFTHQLVIVGRGLNAYAGYELRLRKLITESGLEDRIRMLGFLDHNKLKYLYQNCSVFVFPSSYESFGNPLFEAMAAGVPIVCSNVHSFPEMAGEAAVLVDPLRVDELAEGIRRVLNDTDLSRRLIGAGKERIKNYSWTKCASETVEILGLAFKNARKQNVA